MTAADATILVNGAFTITLPAVAAAPGQVFRIKNIGTGVVTISPPAGGSTIDGAANKTLTVQYSSISVVSDGANYFEV